MGDNEIDKIAENMNPMFNTKQEFHVITKNNKEDNFNVYTILSTGETENIEKLQQIKEIIQVADSTTEGTLKKISNVFKSIFGNLNTILLILSLLFFILSAFYLSKEANNENNENDENDQETEPFVVEDIKDTIQDTIQDNKNIIGYIHSVFAGLHLLSLIYYFYQNRKNKKALEYEDNKLEDFKRSSRGGRRNAMDQSGGIDMNYLSDSKEKASAWFSGEKAKASSWFGDKKAGANASYSNLKETAIQLHQGDKSSFKNVMKIIAHFILLILHTYYALKYLEVFSNVPLFHMVMG